MTALLNDWPAVILRRPLPRPVRPVQDEQLTSYLRRLGTANSIQGHRLAEHLKGSRSGKVPVPSDMVITISGQPAEAMRYAILELCTHEELATMNVAGRPRPGHTGATKCETCMHARGIHDYEGVGCWRRIEDVICHRHQRWIGTSEQIDLTGHDAIIRANKRHRRLIRRYGRRTALYAFGQADFVFIQWARLRHYCQYVDEHLERFHGGSWSLDYGDPTLVAAQYSHVIALTRLLASPYWRGLALRDRDSETGNPDLVSEIQRTVAPTFTWERSYYRAKRDPLVSAFLDDSEAEEARYKISYNLPEPLTDTFESNEMPHDQ